MDPVTLIVTALAAGAAAALQDGTKSAVKTAYARVRELAKRRFAHPDNGEYLMDKHAEDPEIWGTPLNRELEQAGAAYDLDLVMAAQELMGLLDAGGSQEGKYVVSVRDSQGVQIGDGNSQANYFGVTSVHAARDAYVSGRALYINRPQREQADEVGLRMGYGLFPDYSQEDVAGFDVAPGELVHMAFVSNESRRPIRNVVCKYGCHMAVMGGRHVELQHDTSRELSRLVSPIPLSRVRVIRPGERYGFAFELNSHRVLIGGCGEVRFTDDAGQHWQLDEDLHLEPLPDRDW